MEPPIEKYPPKENQTVTERVWLFDVDGVITNPQEKKVTDSEILDQLIRRLKSGEPVALVTGRSLKFLKDRVVGPLSEKLEDKSYLVDLLIVGEKGGAKVTFNQKGELQELLDQSLRVFSPLREEVKHVVDENFASLMFFDDSKMTMISIEMRDGAKLEDFWSKQGKLGKILQGLLTKYNLYGQLRVDATTIATDVEDKKVGKAHASSRVLDWLKERNIKPRGFVVVGDSQSDLDMAKEIDRNNFPVEFIYVGEAQRLRAKDVSFPVVSTKAQYEKGTLEYLRSSN